jgi:hypothetical protein
MRQFPSEVDGAGLRLLAVFPPIGVDDIFDDVGIQKAASEVRRSIGTPRRTAIRTTATSSARRFAMVVGLQGWMRLPFAERRGLARPAK